MVEVMLASEPETPARAIQGGTRMIRTPSDSEWIDNRRFQRRLSVLRASLAVLWIGTAIVSFGVFPVEESFALLERAGVPQAWLGVALFGAAGLDLLLGILTLVSRGRYWVFVAQLLLILGYTVIITVKLPEFWLHPYGPVLKNLPILAAIWLLLCLERRP